MNLDQRTVHFRPPPPEIRQGGVARLGQLDIGDEKLLS
jgi:hypothetical protein